VTELPLQRFDEKRVLSSESEQVGYQMVVEVEDDRAVLPNNDVIHPVRSDEMR
jgi:hypothetical protein